MRGIIVHDIPASAALATGTPATKAAAATRQTRENREIMRWRAGMAYGARAGKTEIGSRPIPSCPRIKRVYGAASRAAIDTQEELNRSGEAFNRRTDAPLPIVSVSLHPGFMPTEACG
jgi:hypothetical protein